jgi:tRNA uridine 5-carboxymethylaminomethyl modification enzyme
MFTSRAEHRILLRQDNADLRLTEIGYKIGLASKERLDKVLEKKSELNSVLDILSNQTVRPEALNAKLKELGTTGLSQPVKAETVLARPQVSLFDMMSADTELNSVIEEVTTNNYVLEQAEIQVKYSGYIQKEFEMVEELAQKENTPIPASLDYSKIKSLSSEGLQKMSKIKPETIGQASRISGVSASDVSVLMVYLKG